MQRALVVLWIAAIALLPGCSPTVKNFDGKQLKVEINGFSNIRYSGSDRVIWLSCNSRTKDNEGCFRGALIHFKKPDEICIGSWWVKKQDGEWKIVVEWNNQYDPSSSSPFSRCNYLPDSDHFRTADVN